MDLKDRQTNFETQIYYIVRSTNSVIGKVAHKMNFIDKVLRRRE